MYTVQHVCVRRTCIAIRWSGGGGGVDGVGDGISCDIMLAVVVLVVLVVLVMLVLLMVVVVLMVMLVVVVLMVMLAVHRHGGVGGCGYGDNSGGFGCDVGGGGVGGD